MQWRKIKDPSQLKSENFTIKDKNHPVMIKVFPIKSNKLQKMQISWISYKVEPKNQAKIYFLLLTNQHKN